ncbi:RNA-binding (RRM domain) [Lecanosticta acicola]|uniref:RNA-binding (RRM domain) n=1 Tax=Lecanosticta acicola TaxID=111012 RepID=A0AAI8YZM8_9PEZI|nr:RNA-binding (RRM domain) [Lecanosticta acicola]
MADQENEDDLFADLYENDDADVAPAAAVKSEPEAPAAAHAVKTEPDADSMPLIAAGSNGGADSGYSPAKQEFRQEFKHEQGMEGVEGMPEHDDYMSPPQEERGIGMKEDGKMFIGGLNWETTDESLKNYFSQFGEVVECTVMRDGQTGRSRGFGFLTFKDPKVVNTVMVKEHQLDNKLIDPKRAIPREEQERTAKIFVGGVSQDATETNFKEFFEKFGRVLDATLMMDKDTGRPRGFGFVTFDNEIAVERTLQGPLAILGKPIEVKRAQPRGKMGEEEAGGQNKFGRGGKPGAQQWGAGNSNGFNANAMAQNGGGGGDGNPNNMTPAMMAQYWQRMQQYFMMMTAGNNMGMMGGMQNPQMMQQMMAQRGMNPQMMQQTMQQMQGGGSPMNGGMGGGQSPGGSASGGTAGMSAQQQQMFEQQKYERAQMARMQQGQFGGQNTWDGMYDDVPAPAGMSPGPQGMGGARGGGGFRGGRGRGGGGPPSGQAPANAPTGPKNAGMPGANYRGGGRGGRRGGFHPYARGGG